MFVYPTFSLQFHWNEINDLWFDWQTLNAGVLAIIASGVFYKTTKYTAKQQNDLTLKANRALLNHKLSDLCEFYTSSFLVLNRLLSMKHNPEITLEEEYFSNTYNALTANKDLSVIAECIKYSTTENAKQLSKYLNAIQIHNSRLKEIIDTHAKDPAVKTQSYLLSCIFKLGSIQLMTNTLFAYARNEIDIINYPFTAKEMHTAYRNLGLVAENEDLIEDFTNTRVNKL